MGNLCCGKQNYQKNITVLLVGLDNAGKTVAAKNLAGESVDSVVPTVGFSMVKLRYKKCNITLFDLGGGANIRGIWDKYFVYSHGIIFVVDSSDYTRLDEAQSVLQDLLSHSKISGKPVLLLANKQDNEYALDEIDLVEKLQLESLVNNKQCPTLVESCSAVEISKKMSVDPGIQRGYRWLMNYIIRNYDQIDKRVQNDVKLQEESERQARLETIERLKILNEREQKNKRNDDVIELYSEYEKQNGTIPTVQDDLLIIRKHEAPEDSASLSSIESIGHIYHINTDRPSSSKSSTQIIKEHIELDHGPKKLFKSFTHNKTMPANLYGTRVPKSASERKNTDLRIDRRCLKSAGDSAFIVNDLPNSVPVTAFGDNLQLFEINNFEPKRTLSPLKFNNGMKSYGRNGIATRHISQETNVSIIQIE